MLKPLDRPNRCTGITTNGQCTKDAQPGSTFCSRHGSHKDLATEQDTRMYQLLKAQDRSRLAALNEHDEIRTLRNEIAIARMLIEERLNLTQNDSDRMTNCGALNSLLLTVERLVQSAHKLETNLGSLLSKPTPLALGNEIVAIIIDELKGVPGYEDIVDRISDRIIKAMAQAGQKSQEN